MDAIFTPGRAVSRQLQLQLERSHLTGVHYVTTRAGFLNRLLVNLAFRMQIRPAFTYTLVTDVRAARVALARAGDPHVAVVRDVDGGRG